MDLRGLGIGECHYVAHYVQELLLGFERESSEPHIKLSVGKREELFRVVSSWHHQDISALFVREPPLDIDLLLKVRRRTVVTKKTFESTRDRFDHETSPSLHPNFRPGHLIGHYWARPVSALDYTPFDCGCQGVKTLNCQA